MQHTQLSKKEQGAIHYAKQQERHRAKQASKTRPSDTRVRTAPGISGKSKPQSEHVSRFPPPRPRNLRQAMSPYAQLLAQLDKILPRK
jgi:hypothetical protein